MDLEGFVHSYDILYKYRRISVSRSTSLHMKTVDVQGEGVFYSDTSFYRLKRKGQFMAAHYTESRLNISTRNAIKLVMKGFFLIRNTAFVASLKETRYKES